MVPQKIDISKTFLPLYHSKKRYFLLTGGRASLKSSTVHDFIARLTYERGHGILFTRYTMVSAELSIIPEFIITLDRLGITADFDITKKRIINKRTGSFIHFSGIKSGSKDMTARLKSIAGITTWVIEEGEDFTDEKAFDIIDDSIRTAGIQNRVIWIQNPTTKEHFIYKRWIEPASKQIKVKGFSVTVSDMPEVEHIHSTYHLAKKQGYLAPGFIRKANGFLNAGREKARALERNFKGSGITELKNELRKMWHSCHYYYNYIGGWLEYAEGVIFDNWIEGVFNNKLPSCNGLDYGFTDPLAMIKVAVDKANKKIYVKQLIYETHLNNIVQEFKNIGISKNELTICDTNEPRTTLRIRNAGFNITHAIKNMIKDDIREIRKWQIIVDPGSKDLKTELNNYVWNDAKAEIPVDMFNHLMDAMRYAFIRLTQFKKAGVRKGRIRPPKIGYKK